MNRQSKSRDTSPRLRKLIVVCQCLTNLRLLKIGSTMLGNQVAGESDLLFLNRRMLSLIGIWPKKTNNLRFFVSCGFICIHVAMEYVDFIQQIGNLERIVDNLSESITFTLLLGKMVVFRENRIMSKMIDAMNKDCASHENQSLQEQKIYATYSSMARTAYKILLFLVSSTATLYYLRPLAELLLASSHNGTTSFVLPYRTRFFYEMTDVYRYAAAYVYQAVSWYIVTIGWVGTDSLLISLTLHVSGQLSVLADCIVNLKKDARDGNHPAIRSVVKRHLRLIWMAKNIDTAFTNTLLGQLLGSSFLICLNGYNVIANSEKTQRASLFMFVLYEFSMLVILYSYCFVGECLIQESNRVLDAFYHCAWYEMPISQSKDLIICMARFQKPLHLSAGKFYIFSMESFTLAVKSSFGYLSVLRTLV